MSSDIRFLYVGDDEELLETFESICERELDAVQIDTTTDPTTVSQTLVRQDIDCIIAEHDVSGVDVLELLEDVREMDPELPFVLYTREDSAEIASKALSDGATDCIREDGSFDHQRLAINRVENAVEQYRLKQTLRENERRLDLLVDQSPFGVIEWSADEFEVVHANRTAAEILGYTPEELTGKAWNDIAPPSDQGEVAEAVEHLMADAGGYHSVTENCRKDGESIVCEWHNQVVTDDQGDVVAILSQFQEVTERIRRREELETQSARLRALFTESPDMIDIHDAEGDIIDSNPRLSEMTGWSPAELHEMKVWELDCNLSREEAFELWDAMEVGDRERLETEYQCRDGTRIPVEIHIRRLDLDGADRFVVVSRDITEQKHRERQLRDRNKQLEEFAGVVSHDLKSPLQVAKTRMELIGDEYESEHVDKVLDSLDRMEVLIDDLLQLAKQGREIRERQRVRLVDIVDSLREDFQLSDATISVDTADAVWGDQRRLEQLFQNLIRNAVDHGGEDVAITVGRTNDGFYIADDGVGIPEEERQDVFTAGYTTSDGGTGFGLSIVREIANAHGWHVDVAESSSDGARFEFTGVEFVDAEDDEQPTEPA